MFYDVKGHLLHLKRASFTMQKVPLLECKRRPIKNERGINFTKEDYALPQPYMYNVTDKRQLHTREIGNYQQKNFPKADLSLPSGTKRTCKTKIKGGYSCHHQTTVPC